MKNRKMSQKITISFAVVIACFLITVVAMFFGMSNISGNYVNFYENGHTALAKTYEGRIYLQTALKNVAFSTAAETASESAEYIKVAQEYVDKMMECADWMTQNYKGDQSLLKEFLTVMEEAKPMRQEIADLTTQETSAADARAREILLSEYNPKIEEGITKLQAFASQILTESNNAYNRSMSTKTALYIAAVAIILFALCITGVMAAPERRWGRRRKCRRWRKYRSRKRDLWEIKGGGFRRLWPVAERREWFIFLRGSSQGYHRRLHCGPVAEPGALKCGYGGRNDCDDVFPACAAECGPGA